MAYQRVKTVDLVMTSEPACAAELALAIIGGKWKFRIYDLLKEGQPVRYCLINTKLKDISEKTLTAQLRELEKDALICRKVYPEVPPRVEYQLTALGKSLQPVLDALTVWGELYIREKKSKTNK